MATTAMVLGSSWRMLPASFRQVHGKRAFGLGSRERVSLPCISILKRGCSSLAQADEDLVKWRERRVFQQRPLCERACGGVLRSSATLRRLEEAFLMACIANTIRLITEHNRSCITRELKSSVCPVQSYRNRQEVHPRPDYYQMGPTSGPCTSEEIHTLCCNAFEVPTIIAGACLLRLTRTLL